VAISREGAVFYGEFVRTGDIQEWLLLSVCIKSLIKGLLSSREGIVEGK
jgi:hypothetical protein